MRRRLLAVILAGVMVFSQAGAVYAAEASTTGSELSEETAGTEAGQADGLDVSDEEESDEAEAVEPGTAETAQPDSEDTAEEITGAEDTDEEIAGVEDVGDSESNDAEGDKETTGRAVDSNDTVEENMETEAGTEAAYMGLEDGEVEVERWWNFGYAELLPGWDHIFIDSVYDAWVRNAEYPNGQVCELRVTGVTAVDEAGENVVFVREEDGGWRLIAQNKGRARIIVTYTDWDGTVNETTDFEVVVGEVVYGVNFDTIDRSWDALPGTDVELEANAWMNRTSPNGNQDYFVDTDEEMGDISFRWELENDWGGRLTIEPDDKNAVLHIGSWPEDRDLWDAYNAGVAVVLEKEESDGTRREVWREERWIRICPSYLTVYPFSFPDEKMNVGDQIVLTPEVRAYSLDENGSEQYTVLDEGVSFHWNYWEEGLDINDNGTNDGSVTIRRKNSSEIRFKVCAEIPQENDDPLEIEREYCLNRNDYWISIRDEQGTGSLFSDGIWSCPIEVRGYEGVAYTLEATIEDHNGPDGASVERACWIDRENERLVIDGTVLKEEGVDWIRVSVKAYVGGYLIDDFSERNFEVRNAYVEDQFNFGTRDMLVDWTQRIDRRQNVYVENGQYPWGEHLERIVTDVEVADESVVKIEYSDDDGWDLRAVALGSTEVTVTYTDWDNTPGHKEIFTLYVGKDVYGIDLWTDSGSDNVLPEGTVAMSASAWHEHRDPENGNNYYYSDEELEGITYEWRIDEDSLDPELIDRGARITVDQDANDPAKATVSFANIPEEWDRTDVNIVIEIIEDGEPKARENYWLHMRREYLELWPTQEGFDNDLDVGEETTITPEIRRYPADNEKGYDILPEDQVKYEFEIYDDQAYTITESKDDPGTFVVRRLRDYDTSFRIKAFVKNDGGGFDEVDNREYWLKSKNYDFWYEIDGNDSIYTDNMNNRTFGFNLENVEQAAFELVPEVGTGQWTEGTGFENPVTEGWYYDSSDHTITFNGKALKDQGIDRIETRISLQIGGIGVAEEWRGFDVRDPWYDFHGNMNDEVIFIDEDRFIDQENSAYTENSMVPDGDEMSYTITGLTYEAEEDPFDTRDPITLEKEENGWRITAVRPGEVSMHAVVSMRHSSGEGVNMTNVTFTVEKDFRVIVGGERFGLNIVTETGSDRLQSGKSVGISTQIYAEGYDWNSGHRYSMDTSDYEMRFEVRCHHVADRIIEERFDGDFDAASRRGVLWDYSVEENGRGIRLISKDENSYEVELEVEAILIDPETGEERARNSRNIFVDRVVMELALMKEDGTTALEWDEALPPGEEVQFVPVLMRNALDGDYSPVDDHTNVTYRLEWYEGGGENDPAHIEVRNIDGEILRPGTQISADDMPLTVKRKVTWDFNFAISAEWEDDEGFMQEVWRDLHCVEVEYSKGFITDNERGNEGMIWYYTDENISVMPDRAKLDALDAQGYDVTTVVEMGLYNGETDSINPIMDYEIGADGHRGALKGEYDISGIFSEQNGLHASGGELEDLFTVLRYQYSETGEDDARVCLRIRSQLGGVDLVNKILMIAVRSQYVEVKGLERNLVVGDVVTWEKGKTVFYVEDSAHVERNEYGNNGKYYEVTITDIELLDEDGNTLQESPYLKAAKEGDDWKLEALSPTGGMHVPVRITFTGDSDIHSCDVGVLVTDGDYVLKLGKDGELEQLDLLVGEKGTLDAKVYYRTETGMEEVPADHCEFEYYSDIERTISVDQATGAYEARGDGRGMFHILYRVFNDDGEEIFGRWHDMSVMSSIRKAELKVSNDAVFYMVPGQSYTAAAICAKYAPVLTIYSMREPGGKEYPITQYGIDRVLSGNGQLVLSGGEEGNYTNVSVNSDAAAGTVRLFMTVSEDNGTRANAECAVKIQSATIAANWTSSSIAKTKYKDVQITFSDGDAIVSAVSSKTATATVKKQGALTSGTAGKLVQTYRITAGTTAGAAKITFKLKSGKTVSLTITVPKVNCTGITAKNSYTVTTLSTINMGVKLNPVYSDNTITYKSANTKIATVTNKGVVKGVKVGKTTITITTNNKKTKKVTIVVKQGTTGLTSAKTAYVAIVGKTVSLGAKKTPTNSADAITYTSANTKIATVSATGVVKGVKAGQTTITIKSGTKSKKVTVTVKPATTNITTTKTAYTVLVKKTVNLGAKKVPAGSGEAIMFTSSNTKIATVNASGVVTGVKAGTVTITIKSGSKTKKVTVAVKPLTTGITTSKTAYTVAVKKTVNLGAKKVPAGSGEAITFTSSNTKVATVNASGVVTGVKKGTVTITIKSGSIKKTVKVTVK